MFFFLVSIKLQVVSITITTEIVTTTNIANRLVIIPLPFTLHLPDCFRLEASADGYKYITTEQKVHPQADGWQELRMNGQ